MKGPDDCPYVSRGGIKLARALDAFGLQPAGLCCADLGSHVGGFVDCLLLRGAARVYAVDTCYGTLAWKLRRDPRVVVRERTNALHVTLPEAVDLVTVDVGWTRQKHVLPQARTLLRTTGCVITLIKPHYEAEPRQLADGVLAQQHYDAVVEGVLEEIRRLGFGVQGRVDSPLTGHGGNRELLAWLTPEVEGGRQTEVDARRLDPDC